MLTKNTSVILAFLIKYFLKKLIVKVLWGFNDEL